MSRALPPDATYILCPRVGRPGEQAVRAAPGSLITTCAGCGAAVRIAASGVRTGATPVCGRAAEGGVAVPVTVSLADLVALPGARTLWPAEFNALVDRLLDEPNEKAQWGVIADWLDEAERGEHALADAFRWVAKRANVTARLAMHCKPPRWEFVGLPAALNSVIWPESDRTTIPGLVAALAFALKSVREILA